VVIPPKPSPGARLAREPERRGQALNGRDAGVSKDNSAAPALEPNRYDSVVAETPAPESTQYVAYRFFQVDPAWRRLPVEERAAHKDAFAEVVEEWQERMQILAYSLVGVRAEADLFLWLLSERYEDLRDLAAELNATPLAGWLATPHSYLAATLSSKYFERDPKRPPRRVVPRRAPYLVVYPFVKVRPWYSLPVEDRTRAMHEHADVGSRFRTVTNHTTYSFGIDDQEFMTAFECEEPVDFLHLMMTLRETEASRYTERDTPIFVGVLEDIRSILDSLDGAKTRVGAGD
jgi:chlorite dismutase